MITQHEAHEIGIEAYIYFYPLLTMDITRRVMTNAEPGAMVGRGPANTFAHVRAYPTADMRVVVRPNFDTLYSSAWFDLTEGPLVVSVPDTDGRYYLLPFLDMWTDVFAVPGWRTSGTQATHFALLPPGWHGDLPPGVEPIQAPTPLVWTIGRTQTNGPRDYAAVHAIQDGFVITPLARWGQDPPPIAFQLDPTVDMATEPLRQVNALSAAGYFAYASELLQRHPPHLADWSTLARLRRIGIERGKRFDSGALDPAIRAALEAVPADAQAKLQAAVPHQGRVVNGWVTATDSMGTYGNFYLRRACVALVGLGANPPEDAVYPLNLGDADGKPLDGANDYVLHFDRQDLPPVDAFWSVTMYDAEGYQAANPLDRFAIGDRDALAYNPDGSLDLYLQHESPGADKETNWLPAPRGPLGVTMRLYAPKPAVLDGTWNPTAIQRVS